MAEHSTQLLTTDSDGNYGTTHKTYLLGDVLELREDLLRGGAAAYAHFERHDAVQGAPDNTWN